MKKFIFLMIAVLFFSCETAEKKPLVFSEVISKDNMSAVAEKISSDANISGEQIEVLNRGISRLALAGNDTIVGLTLGEIYNYQKDFRKEQALAAMNENINKVSLIMNHSFKYIGLVPREDSLDFIVYEITNNSNKDIKNLTGVLQFYNTNNQLVKQYPLRLDVALNNEDEKIIKSGDTKRLTLPYVHNKENVRDSIMRFGRNNLKTLWQPRGILFTDDTKISIDN